jgi:uncharacterized membrane protein YgdD (TMEM256/DUF423 family)
MKNHTILISGAIFMALSVLFGAFGAHALKTRLTPEMMQVYQIGVEYQFYHALGLLFAGIIGFQIDSKWVGRAAMFLGIGIILFSGSLYLIALSGIKAIGVITPIGGLSFIAGWISLAIGVWKK